MFYNSKLGMKNRSISANRFLNKIKYSKQTNFSVVLTDKNMFYSYFLSKLITMLICIVLNNGHHYKAASQKYLKK